MKKYIYLIIIILLSLINYSIEAQVNTEKYRNPLEAKGFSGYGKIDISAQTGNTDLQEMNLSGRIDWENKTTHIFLIGQGEYGWKDKISFSDQALLHLRYVHSLNSVFKGEVFTQVNYDKAILLDFRSLAGAGFRVKIFKDSLNEFWFGTAYMFEHEKYKLPSNSIHKHIENLSRWSNYLSYNLYINDNTQLLSVIYYQPSLKNFSDNRILTETSLMVNITNKLGITVGFNLRYDSKPPDTIKSTDTKTTFGFIYRFY